MEHSLEQKQTRLVVQALLQLCEKHLTVHSSLEALEIAGSLPAWFKRTFEYHDDIITLLKDADHKLKYHAFEISDAWLSSLQRAYEKTEARLVKNRSRRQDWTFLIYILYEQRQSSLKEDSEESKRTRIALFNLAKPYHGKQLWSLNAVEQLECICDSVPKMSEKERKSIYVSRLVRSLCKDVQPVYQRLNR